MELYWKTTMELKDFKIGEVFLMSDCRWLCTDIGTRTVAAVKLDKVEVTTQDKSGSFTRKMCIDLDSDWLNGPPYTLPELVIDENDMEVCCSLEVDNGEITEG
jgi:hypothetical protein